VKTGGGEEASTRRISSCFRVGQNDSAGQPLRLCGKTERSTVGWIKTELEGRERRMARKTIREEKE